MNASTHNASATSLVTQLESIVGATRVLTSDEDRQFFSQDIAGPRAHVAACVVQPQSVAELSAVVSAAAAAGHAVVPRGGGSSYTGG